MVMIEARRAERVRSFLRARIVFNNNNSTIDCVIKNFSPFGAKIELGNALSVPSEFDLEVPQKGRTFRARMMWRDDQAIGVDFVEDDNRRESGNEKLERLEMENKKLRANVLALAKRLEDLGQDVTYC